MSDSMPGRAASGYSTWRLIAEELRADIADGRLEDGHRLSSENALASRFGVNRHTVRRAIASLSDDGLVESHRGSGVYVTGSPVHMHRIGMRTRLSTSLGDQHTSSSRILESATEDAPPRVARLLSLAESAPTVRVESLRSVESKPFALSTAWFDAERLPNIAAELLRTSSVTKALRASGIDDYIRVSTGITARHASATESTLLELDPGAIVLVTESLDALPDGTPLQHLVTRFAAGRVRLSVEHGSEA